MRSSYLKQLWNVVFDIIVFEILVDNLQIIYRERQRRQQKLISVFCFPPQYFFRLRYVIYLTQLVSSYMSVLDRTIAVFVFELALLLLLEKVKQTLLRSNPQGI